MLIETRLMDGKILLRIMKNNWMTKKYGELQQKRMKQINNNKFSIRENNNILLLIRMQFKLHPIIQDLEKRERKVEVVAAVAAMRKRKDNLKKIHLPLIKENNNNLQLILSNNHNILLLLTLAVAKEETKKLKKNQIPQIVVFISV